MLRNRTATATATYRSMHVASSPARLLDGLYHRLLADFKDAERSIEHREIAEKAEAVNHGLVILGELDAALDHDHAPELCAHLTQLYGFVRNRLLAASLLMDPAPLVEARRVILTLRESFASASGVTP